MDFRPTSGRSSGADALAFALVVAAGCYSFSGGGGFPSDVQTMFIAPIENRTPQFDLDSELFRKLSESLPRSLGVRSAGEQVADAILRGSIVRYEDIAQSYQPGQAGNVNVIQNQITVVVSIQIIDVKRNEVLWESQSVTGRGEYRPDSQQDRIAWQKALDSVIQQIIDGAQSQW
jgi:hypothetical protein